MLLLHRLEAFIDVDINNEGKSLGQDFNHKGLYKLAAAIAVGGAKVQQKFLVPLE